MKGTMRRYISQGLSPQKITTQVIIKNNYYYSLSSKFYAQNLQPFNAWFNNEFRISDVFLQFLPCGSKLRENMGDPVPALRYIKSQFILYTLILLFSMQQHPRLPVPEANQAFKRCSAAPALGKGKRRGREGSETSSSTNDPIEDLVEPDTLANGIPLIGPGAARELDRRRKDDNEVKKDNDKGSLNIKIHLDLHAKVKLDLEADIYGDIVIGLL